jgi:two-component system response regulator FixJ
LSPIYIINDDSAVRSSLVILLRSLGLQARPFAQAADFIEEVDFLDPGAVLADLRMPGMSSHDLLHELRRRDCFWPAIMMSGHGDIALAVPAMKFGALEFLGKPFADEQLVAALQECSCALRAADLRSRQARVARKALGTLSTRERQVFEGVVGGRTSKEIARELELSPRTVESYRETMMAKLGANSLHDLLAVTLPEEGAAR